MSSELKLAPNGVTDRIGTLGVLLANPEGVIVSAHTASHRLLGHDSAELAGSNIDKVVPGISTWLKTHVLEAAQDRAFAEIRKRSDASLPDGSFQPVELVINRFYTGMEWLTCLLVSVVPAREAEPSCLLVVDRSGKIVLINRAGCELLGCAEEAITGLNWLDNFLPNDQRSYQQNIFEEVFLRATDETYECPVLTLKADRHLLTWRTSLVYDSTGLPACLLNLGWDSGKKMGKEIDVQHIERIRNLNKQLEQSVKRQTHELIHSLASVESINRDLQLQIQKRKAIEQKLIKIQRLYDTMVHNFPDGVIGVLNREMKYVLIDGKDLNEIDLPALGLMGQKPAETQDPAVAEHTISQIRKAFEGQSLSFEVKTKDRYYNIAAVPLPDAHNHINEILCVLKNVTERKRMEQGLLKALEKEKELGELKSRFVTMASHEFKTPLATILSSTFLLENYTGEDYDKEKKIHTTRIRRSVNNLTLILNEFLSLEKLEENQVKVVNIHINLPKFMRELISEVEMVKQKGQTIEYRHSGSQRTAYLDPHVLWSIVTNLISNGLKYSREGDKIEICTETTYQHIKIRVRDYGIGIPPDEHKHIFSRFHRARNAMNFEGTGLGLHIVEKNVKLLKGQIHFTSQLNIGTEFTVVLPNGTSNPPMNQIAKL